MCVYEVYDGNKVEYMDVLKKLWLFVFGLKVLFKDLKSESWKEMGW